MSSLPSTKQNPNAYHFQFDAATNLPLLGDETGFVRLFLKDKTPDSIAEAMGNILEALRSLRKLSLEEVSEKTGISIHRLTNIEEVGHG